jgi:cysteine desulfurase
MNIRSEIAPSPVALRRPIYLDHHATTPVDRRVAALMLQVMTEQFGNPNDRGHLYGVEARRIVDDARIRVGELFNAEPEGVVFAASATTAADRLFRRLAAMAGGRPLRVVTTAVEHHGVLDSLRRLEQSGACEISSLGVDERARLDLAEIDAELAKGCDLLFVMAANN